MEITVHFTAQLKRSLGMATDKVLLPLGGTTADLWLALANRFGAPFTDVALEVDGRLASSMLLCINQVQVPRGAERALRDGDEVHVISAISGG